MSPSLKNDAAAQGTSNADAEGALWSFEHFFWVAKPEQNVGKASCRSVQLAGGNSAVSAFKKPLRRSAARSPVQARDGVDAGWYP